MLRLCTAANLPEAHLLLHQLVHAGIEATYFFEKTPRKLSIRLSKYAAELGNTEPRAENWE